MHDITLAINLNIKPFLYSYCDLSEEQQSEIRQNMNWYFELKSSQDEDGVEIGVFPNAEFKKKFQG